MKAVSVLGFVAVVGVLGVAIYIVTNPSTDIGFTTKATASMTVSGVLEAPSPTACEERFYIGCYKVMFEGKEFDLVEKNPAVKLNSFVGKNIEATGEIADVKGKNVLMVTSVFAR